MCLNGAFHKTVAILLTVFSQCLICSDVEELKPRRPLSRPSSPFSRPSSPFALDDVTQRVRQQNLITRYNDMFAQDRLDAMDTLRRYSDDHENNQRILHTTVQVEYALTTCKKTWWIFVNIVGSVSYGLHTFEF